METETRKALKALYRARQELTETILILENQLGIKQSWDDGLVMEEVCKYFGVNPEHLKAKHRGRDTHVVPRHIFYKLCKEFYQT